MGLFKKIGRGISKVGNTIGQNLGLAESEGEKRAKKAATLFENLKAPVLSDVELNRFENVGDARDFVTDQQATEFDAIQEDPALRDAQLNNLNQFSEMAANDGLTTSDKAKLDQINREQAIAERGQREALLRNAQARGVGGSGVSLASRLAAQQGAADRAGTQANAVNADMLNRQIRALESSSNIASNIRNQDFTRDSSRAQAQDAINRFNAVQNTDAGQRQFANLQDIANQNTGVSNQETLLNKVDLPQQNFSNQMDLASSRANAQNTIGAASDRRVDKFGKAVGGAAKLAAGMAKPGK